MRPHRDDLELRSREKHDAVHVRHEAPAALDGGRQTDNSNRRPAGQRQSFAHAAHYNRREGERERAEDERNHADDAISARAVRYVR